MVTRLKGLEQKILLSDPDADIDLIKKAYDFSARKLKGKKHYITRRPLLDQALETAGILVDFNVDTLTLVGALLYYSVVYGNASFEEVKEQFSPEIADLLSNLKKFKDYQLKVTNPEDERKLFLAAAKNPRLIFIRMAKRLAYMRLLDKAPRQEQIRFSEQTLATRVPIVYKMGLYTLKSEMEDLALKYIDPKAYAEIKAAMDKKEHMLELEKLKGQLEKTLKKSNIPAKVLGRPKRIYSIYKKMQRKGQPLEEIFDLTGLRVITDSKKRCYEILGLVHSLWKPIPEEFDDYIAKPKPNGYQSLHSTMISSSGKIFEVQIRTAEMDRVAEYGLAMHWRYKGVAGDKKYDKKLSWFKQMMEWRKDFHKSEEFVDSLKKDFFEDEIFVFTPKQQVVALPQGSTPLDFAYAVHTAIGHTAVKAKVNDKLVPLGEELHSGDVVEITTSPGQKPKRNWLNMVKTSKAKTKIRIKLKLEVRGSKREKLLEAKGESMTIKEGVNSQTRLARCCMPIPGDQVIGYLTTKRKVIVHRKTCPNALKQKNSRRVLKVHWAAKGKSKFLAELKVTALSRESLLTDLLQVFLSSKANLKATDAKTSKDKTNSIFTVETRNQAELDALTKNLSLVEGVISVDRSLPA